LSPTDAVDRWSNVVRRETGARRLELVDRGLNIFTRERVRMRGHRLGAPRRSPAASSSRRAWKETPTAAGQPVDLPCAQPSACTRHRGCLEEQTPSACPDSSPKPRRRDKDAKRDQASLTGDSACAAAPRARGRGRSVADDAREWPRCRGKAKCRA
jgi:hypothetical protein